MRRWAPTGLIILLVLSSGCLWVTGGDQQRPKTPSPDEDNINTYYISKVIESSERTNHIAVQPYSIPRTYTNETYATSYVKVRESKNPDSKVITKYQVVIDLSKDEVRCVMEVEMIPASKSGVKTCR